MSRHNKRQAYQALANFLSVSMLGLLFLSFSTVYDLQNDRPSRDVIVLNLENTINLALRGEKLFDAQASIRSAELNQELSLTEFDLNITPKADTGLIGGGSAGTGFTVGGGVAFDKKLPIGTQITMTPSLLQAAKKFHSTFQVRVSQPLLRGFGQDYNYSGIRRAEFGYRTASRAFYKGMSFTVLRAIELLYAVAKQEQLVKLNEESCQRLERFWRSTNIKERIGLSDALDVYRAEIEFKQAEDALNQSKENLQDAKDLLLDTLSLPQDTKFIVRVSLELSEEEWDLQEAIATALENRIEIYQGLDQIEESRRLSRLSKNNLLPDLNIVLDYSNLGYGEEFTGSFGRKRESRWGIGFTTSSDVNRVFEKSSYENSLLSLETAQKVNSELKKTIALEVKRTFRAFSRTREKIALQQEQIKNSEGGLQLAKAKFLREYATNFDVLQAEKAFYTAQMALVSALIEHKVGEYRLKAAIGLLIEKPRFYGYN